MTNTYTSNIEIRKSGNQKKVKGLFATKKIKKDEVILQETFTVFENEKTPNDDHVPLIVRLAFSNCK
ncbi:MAG: hypothetical protein ACI87Q_000856 [Pseudohongiellaceae bacterium]|jgi:hypothetical protein